MLRTKPSSLSRGLCEKLFAPALSVVNNKLCCFSSLSFPSNILSSPCTNPKRQTSPLLSSSSWETENWTCERIALLWTGGCRGGARGRTCHGSTNRKSPCFVLFCFYSGKPPPRPSFFKGFFGIHSDIERAG